VFVSDSQNHCIRKFTNNGDFIKKWKDVYSFGVTLNPNSDNLYVSDVNYDKIKKFTADGNLILEFGALGEENSKFDELQRIAVNPNIDNLFVADSKNYSIQKFTADGIYM